MYNQCKMCANTTIIAFQDTNGFVQIGNRTSDGWASTQIGPTLDQEGNWTRVIAILPQWVGGSDQPLLSEVELQYELDKLETSLIK